MRTLKRNQRKFCYALFLGKTAYIDADGYETGEQIVEYSDAVFMNACVTPRTGDVQVQPFGTDVSFDQVILTDDMQCKIDENSIICIDEEPVIEDGKLVNYDYIVTKVSKSLNHIAIAISKVKVNGN